MQKDPRKRKLRLTSAAIELVIVARAKKNGEGNLRSVGLCPRKAEESLTPV
jgi:hypothetical protein